MFEVSIFMVVGMTVVVFVLGYLLGSKGMYRTIQESVNAGVTVGAQVQRSLMIQPTNLELEEKETDSNHTVGFNLRGKN